MCLTTESSSQAFSNGRLRSSVSLGLLFTIGREQAGHQKLVHLHEHEKHSNLFTAREKACPDFTVKYVATPTRSPTKFRSLREELEKYNRGKAEMDDFDQAFVRKWASYSDAQHAALLDAAGGADLAHWTILLAESLV